MAFPTERLVAVVVVMYKTSKTILLYQVERHLQDDHLLGSQPDEMMMLNPKKLFIHYHAEHAWQTCDR